METRIGFKPMITGLQPVALIHLANGSLLNNMAEVVGFEPTIRESKSRALDQLGDTSIHIYGGR